MSEEVPPETTQDSQTHASGQEAAPPQEAGKALAAGSPAPGGPDSNTLKAIGPGSGAPAMPLPAKVGFLLFAAFFVLLGFMAWFSKSTNITNITPAVISALLGLITNPSAATDPSKPAPAPPFGKESLAQWPWKALIITGILSTFACAWAMVSSGHPAAQGAFEVVGGGLFGLLIDTSQLSPFQALLQAIQSGFNKQQ